MKKINLFILIILACNLSAQTFQKKLKDNVSTFGVDIVADNSVGYNIVSNTNRSDSSFIINTELDLAGNIVWSKLFAGSKKIYARKLIPLSYGRMILGYTKSVNDTIKSAIIKTDNNGNIIWSKRYQNGKTLNFHDALVMADKSSFIVGVNDSLGLDSNVFVTKIDSMGQVLFSKTYAGSGKDYGNSIIKSSDGNLVIVGYSNTTDVNGDILVMKIDTTGNLLWSKLYNITFNTYKKQFGYGLTENHNGKLVICGTTKNSVFMPGDEAWSPVILWLEQNGNLIKSNMYFLNSGANAAMGIKELSNYHYYYTGSSTLPLNPLIVASELDSSGAALWSKFYTGNNRSATIKSNSSVYINQNEFITVGSYFSAIDTSVYIIKTANQGNSGCNEFVTGNGTNSVVTNVSNISFITHNLLGITHSIQIISSNKNLTDSTYCSNIITGIKENTTLNNGVNLYPLPASDYIIVELSNASQNSLISIYNLQGKLLLNQTYTKEKTEINISAFTKGLYFVKVNNGNDIVVKKFIKE